MDALERKRLAARNWATRKREEYAAKGMVQISGFVHSHQAAEAKRILQMLEENPDLAITVLRDERTGQFVKV